MAKGLGYKVYDKENIFDLLKDFNIKKIECYIGLERKYWTPASVEEAEKIDSTSKGYVQAVACVLCSKRRT